MLTFFGILALAAISTFFEMSPFRFSALTMVLDSLKGRLKYLDYDTIPFEQISLVECYTFSVQHLCVVPIPLYLSPRLRWLRCYFAVAAVAAPLQKRLEKFS